MTREYRYISLDVMAERLLSQLQGLEAEHLQLSSELAAAKKLPGEADESFERRKQGLQDRIDSIEQTIAALEQDSPRPVMEKVEYLAMEQRALARIFEFSGATGGTAG